MGLKKRSKSKAHQSSDRKNEDDEMEQDDRFRAATTRPQFSKPKEQSSKVVLDDRFSSVLTDPRFRLQEKDKYGRKSKASVENELSSFYTVDRGEHDDDDASRSSDAEDQQDNETPEEEQTQTDKDDTEDPGSRIAYLTALSRGELSVSSSSDDEIDSDSPDSDSDKDEEDSVYGVSGILDPSYQHDQNQVSRTTESTRFMAITNMDWTNVRAVDLFSILSSFTPPGSVKRVQVFPSNFGIERMAQDTLYGPTNLWKNKGKNRGDRSGDNLDKNEPVSEDDDNSSNDDLGQDDDDSNQPMLRIEENVTDTDFDMEKLRAYEAAKLKYYFAVIEFASPEHADVAYREVDGLEFEHSSAALDMRAIPSADLESVTEARKLRDEATCIPGNYDPPDFIVNALQQTTVQCTWEDGELDRERRLTGYGRGDRGKWNLLTEADDLRAYLASDGSSGEEDDEDSDKEREGKGSNMRKLLGLDSDSETDRSHQQSSGQSVSAEEEEVNGYDENEVVKQVTFVPGKGKLEEKIRNKLEAKKEETDELTPWEKYQLKRKEKRRERRQSRRKGRGDVESPLVDKAVDDGMYGSDPEFGKAEFGSDDNDDDFFVNEGGAQKTKSTPRESRKTPDSKRGRGQVEDAPGRTPSSKAELELLLAGDDDEEDARDYDMRGLRRIDKNKGKKLRGARKRKEAEAAANVSGADFRIDTRDARFASLMDGVDDRFGIDPTDPSFKETTGMRQIMAEQTKRRKSKKRAKRTSETVTPDISAEASTASSGGAAALSSLVTSLKSKVAKRAQ